MSKIIGTLYYKGFHGVIGSNHKGYLLFSIDDYYYGFIKNDVEKIVRSNVPVVSSGSGKNEVIAVNEFWWLAVEGISDASIADRLKQLIDDLVDFEFTMKFEPKNSEMEMAA